MPITVYFATNRALTGPADQVSSYSANIVNPADPGAVTYATAFVNEVDLTADTTGAITSIQNIKQGGFDDGPLGDLGEDPGRNLLIFLHGFANSFEDGITRAAFNRQWFAASGVPAADTTVVAFTWPSAGILLEPPLLKTAYKQDQGMAGQSGLHIMSFFANLQPLIVSARAHGRRVFLLAHSMGNWALQAAVQSWFTLGNGDAFLFDEVILAAADEVHNSFDLPPIGRLSALNRLCRRISIYASEADQVLDVSFLFNDLTKRLGRDGPDNAGDPNRFPPATYRTVNCSGFRDYDVNFQYSHQYYRRSPGVRTDIAKTLVG
jgi:esterase/lipase superfamily enzyme